MSSGEQRACTPQSRASEQAPVASCTKQASQRQPEPCVQDPWMQSSGWPQVGPLVQLWALQLQAPPAPQGCPLQKEEFLANTAHSPHAF